LGVTISTMQEVAKFKHEVFELKSRNYFEQRRHNLREEKRQEL